MNSDFATFDVQYNLEPVVERAVLARAISAEEGARWLASLRQVVRAGFFFTSMTNFVVSGRKV